MKLSGASHQNGTLSTAAVTETEAEDGPSWKSEPAGTAGAAVTNKVTVTDGTTVTDRVAVTDTHTALWPVVHTLSLQSVRNGFRHGRGATYGRPVNMQKSVLLPEPSPRVKVEPRENTTLPAS